MVFVVVVVAASVAAALVVVVSAAFSPVVATDWLVSTVGPVASALFV